MNWKQIIITSIITLGITIFSGIAVNWYTKNKIEKTESKDNLFYSVSDISEFKSDSTKLSLLTLLVVNKNAEKYTNVQLNIELNKNSSIIDIVSKNLRTGKNYFPVDKEKNNIAFKFPILYPNDKIKINIALRNLENKPKIILQSDEIVGKLYDPFIEFERKLNNDTQYYEIIFLTILLLILIFIIYKRGYNLMKISSNNLNNTAFLFLHNKQVETSHKLLLNYIEKNGASAFEFANLACAEYLLTQNLDKAKSLLEMSNYISETNASKFVISFNEFIIMAHEKNYLVAKEKLEDCNKLNNREFKKYLKFSLIVKDLINSDDTIKELISRVN